MTSKQAALVKLAIKRQKKCWPGYRNIADYHKGIHECAYVSPYTKSANNVDANIFILLQDWTCHDRLKQKLDLEVAWLGHDPRLRTNRQLKQLLEQTFQLQLRDTYATNLFPFIKMGAMNAPIPLEDLRRAAKEYALPQIEIVSPGLVVCLGLNTFRAMQTVCGQEAASTFADAIERPFEWKSCLIWCQAHTGGLGQANRNRGDANRVVRDWRRMKKSFDKWLESN